MTGGRQVMVPTARSDVYVSLLGVALGAILIGCILLALVMHRYDFQVSAPKLAGMRAASPVASGVLTPSRIGIVRA